MILLAAVKDRMVNSVETRVIFILIGRMRRVQKESALSIEIGLNKEPA